MIQRMRRFPPDTVRLWRIAGWMWLGYLLALIVIDTLMYANAPRYSLIVYYLGQGAIAALFLGLSYWSWVEKTLQRYFAPLMLLIISGLPLVVGRFYMPPLPPGPMSNIEGLALRLLPVLFIALVITAWQYGRPYVIVFAAGTAGLEIAMTSARPPLPASAFQAIVFIAIVRSVSFLVVGYFISRLMRQLQAQADALAQANIQLTDYASTLEQLTISRERNRLARELHDTLAHTLSGLSVQLETVKAYWDVKPETARQLLNQSLSATRSGLNETRRALKALRASPLDDLGLLLALRRLAETAAGRGKLKLQLALPEKTPSLSSAVEQCIYRVAQEAIENVIQHANASNMSLNLATDKAEISLEIKDDGVGMDVKQAERMGHYGLAGMHERAQLVNGQLSLQSVYGRGVCIQLKIQGYQQHESHHL